MNVANRGSAGALAFALASTLFAGPSAAQAADARCSHDSLTIEGLAVAVALCTTKTDAKSVSVVENFNSKNATLSHTTTIDLLPGEDSSRGIDDVPLAALGIAKTLHMTMHYKAGTISLEHALLLPGAVPLK